MRLMESSHLCKNRICLAAHACWFRLFSGEENSGTSVSGGREMFPTFSF